MKRSFKVGDLVTYCGPYYDVRDKVGIVCRLDYDSPILWCIFGVHTIGVLPRHLRFMKNRKKE
tara:strand:+ start:7031 stop:7219 length:189 start_codon:yes stop_codon:yes gene_type:complete